MTCDPEGRPVGGRDELDGSRRGSGSRPVLLHVGYMKTGSTWLQRHVTNNRADGFMEIANRKAIRELLIQPNDLWYDPAPFRRHIAARLDEARGLNLTPVVTQERLAGNPISGGIDSNSLALRLLDLFVDARVLIVIREQRSHLLSIYNEYVNGGGSCSLDSFLHPPPGAKLPLFDYRFLEFHRLIGRYQELFVHERVKVLPFELFRRDRDAFCREIYGFMDRSFRGLMPGQALRPSMGAAAVQIRRRLNFLFCRDNSNPSAPWRVPGVARASGWMGKLVPGAVDRAILARQRARIARFVGDRYAESNRLTQLATGLPLADYGYL